MDPQSSAKGGAAAASSSSASNVQARLLNMRYYENELPEIGELVHVKFTSLTDNSAYVQLLEYANIQGMITFSELHRGRITSLATYAKIDKEEVMVVIRKDDEKKYIDLSMRTLTTDDKEKGYRKAQRGRDVLNYLCTISDNCQVPLQMLMEKVAWTLAKQYPKSDTSEGGALEGLKEAVKNPDIIKKLDLPEKVKAELDRIVQLKLKPKVRKYEADLSVTCNSVEGVDSIKAVLLAGEKSTNGAVKVTVKASPHYMLRTESADRDEALKTLTDSIATMKMIASTLAVVIEVDKEPCDVGGDAPAK